MNKEFLQPDHEGDEESYDPIFPDAPFILGEQADREARERRLQEVSEKATEKEQVARFGIADNVYDRIDKSKGAKTGKKSDSIKYTKPVPQGAIDFCSAQDARRALRIANRVHNTNN